MDSRVFPQRYQVLRRLGVGGMGTVFEARDTELQRRVAIKSLHGNLAGESGVLSRFLREARAMAQVSHPNLVQIYDFLIQPGESYLVLELIEGEDLGKRLLRGPLELPELLRLTRELGGALVALHENGILHRDIKPANVMLRADSGAAVLMDLGLASVTNETALTLTGMIVGTPRYIPLGVYQGHPWSQKEDLYALAAVLFEAAVGAPMVPGEDAITLHKNLTKGVFSPFTGKARELPKAFRRALRAGGAKEAKDRPADVASFVASIEQAFEGASPVRPARESPPPSFRGRWLYLAGAVLSLVLLWTQNEAVPKTVSVGMTAPQSLFPEGYAESLRQELVEAGTWMVDPQGRRQPIGSKGLPEGHTELLSPDPLRWYPHLRLLPKLSLYLDWLEQGGKPEVLDSDLASDLIEVGARYRSNGMASPFFPALLTKPNPGMVPFPPELRERWHGSLPSGAPEQMTGWFATALLALNESVIYLRRFQREVALGRPAAIPKSIYFFLQNNLAGGGRSATFSRMVIMSLPVGMPERVALAEWIRPGTRSLQRFFYAAGRSVREEPETREALPILLREFLGNNYEWKLTQFLVGAPCRQDPNMALGGPPLSPQGWHLQALFLKAQRDAQNNKVLPTEGLFLQEMMAFERARLATSADDLSLQRVSQSLLDGLDSAIEWRSGERIRKKLDQLYQLHSRATASQRAKVFRSVRGQFKRRPVWPEVRGDLLLFAPRFRDLFDRLTEDERRSFREDLEWMENPK